MTVLRDFSRIVGQGIIFKTEAGVISRQAVKYESLIEVDECKFQGDTPDIYLHLLGYAPGGYLCMPRR